MLNSNASAIGIDGVYRRIVRFENRQPTGMSLPYGESHTTPNALDDFIQCRSYERHALKIGEGVDPFNCGHPSEGLEIVLAGRESGRHV